MRYRRNGNYSPYSRMRRNLDLERLSALRNPDLELDRLQALRRNPRNLKRKSYLDSISFRRNPAPDGTPWGPSLYNPLEDSNNTFKDDKHYKKVISKLRRNPDPESLPWSRNRANPSCSCGCLDCKCQSSRRFNRNPVECSDCGESNCLCQPIKGRLLRRRNPERNFHADGCSSCGLRFGLHSRMCTRGDW